MGNVYLLFLVSFLCQSVTASVPYLFALTRQFGGSVETVLFLQFEFIVLLALLQVPTGRFADRYGCKTAIMIGVIASLIGSACYLFGHSLAVFCVGEAIWATGASFVLGADSALLKSSLQESGKSEEFQRYRSRLALLQTASRSLFFVIGGILSAYSLYAPFVLVVCFLTAAFIASLFLQELANEVPVQVRELRSMCGEYLHLGSATGKIVYAQAVALSATYIGFWLSTPWLESHDCDPFTIGLVLALLALSAMIASTIAGRLRVGGSIFAFTLLMMAAFLGFLFLSLPSFYLGLLGLLLQKAVYGFTDVLLESHLLDIGRRHERATILSIAGMLRNFFMAATLLFCILLDSFLSLSGIFLILATLGFAATIALGVLKRYDSVRNYCKS